MNTLLSIATVGFAHRPLSTDSDFQPIRGRWTAPHSTAADGNTPDVASDALSAVNVSVSECGGYTSSMPAAIAAGQPQVVNASVQMVWRGQGNLPEVTPPAHRARSPLT